VKDAPVKTLVGFEKILFATDLSPAAGQAIPYVMKIAEHYGVDLLAFPVRLPWVNPMVSAGTVAR
jgi:SpoU rRNA methylase family enzyme